ncbi:MAG: glycosyltransferase family 2 protein [Aquificaceae bacterium]
MISVVMTVYNGERYIKRAIDSALGQRAKDLEVIVIDDCSKDRTQEVIFKDYGDLIGKRIFYYRNPENKERSYSRNKGFELSRGGMFSFWITMTNGKRIMWKALWST